MIRRKRLLLADVPGQLPVLFPHQDAVLDAVLGPLPQGAQGPAAAVAVSRVVGADAAGDVRPVKKAHNFGVDERVEGGKQLLPTEESAERRDESLLSEELALLFCGSWSVVIQRAMTPAI